MGSTPPVGGTERDLLLNLRLSAVPASCAHARREISAVLEGFALDVAAIELAVSEAVTNVVVHAYRDRADGGEPGSVGVRLTADEEGVWVAVLDEGIGMVPRDDSPGLGLGLRIIATLSDQLLVVQGDTGTRLHMRFGFADGSG
jgi:anti-sigma regulatory factor (Ser/Thr protein kinase)